jgi:hypothetical protein
VTNRPKWIAAAVAVLAVLVIVVWIFAGTAKDEGDEAEKVTSAPPKISHSSGGEIVVELNRDEQARIGLETAGLTAVTQSQEATAYGVVLDPAPLAALNAELASTRAAVAASRAEYERARLLHSEQQNVSLKDFEAARAKFQADQAQLNLRYQRLADEWGVQLSAMTPAERASLIDALTKRIAGIVRLSLPTRIHWSPVRSGTRRRPILIFRAKVSCSRSRRKDFLFARAPPLPAIWSRPELQSRG